MKPDSHYLFWFAFAITTTVAGFTVQAHPGHGATPVPTDSVVHWVLDPGHLSGWLGLGLVLWSWHCARSLWKDRAGARVRKINPSNTP